LAIFNNNACVGVLRKCDDLLRDPRLQALTIIGIDAAMTLCLGFSIAGSFRSAKAGAIDYTRYWRRSLLAALGSRCFGEALGLPDSEDLFLAGLLQDIGVVALDRASPGFYSELPPDAIHTLRIEYERQRLGDDHAALGAWLLGTWSLPDNLCQAVDRSHTPETTDGATEAGRFARCVALGSELASGFLASNSREALLHLGDRGRDLLGFTIEQVGQVIEQVTQLTPDLGRLFDTSLLTPEAALALSERAQELLSVRSVASLQRIGTLEEAAQLLAARSDAIEAAGRRDALTAVFSRRHLDQQLAAEFAAARAGSWPLGVLFIDLDHFKHVNDTYGHAVGDEVLRGAATLLMGTLRATDTIGRYGGEEFVVVMPGASLKDAAGLAERLLTALRRHPYQCGDVKFHVTASVGLAVVTPATPFSDPAALLAAADAAAYAAKRAGRDQLVVYASSADSRQSSTLP
jgi:diguanylate cyclase (GGDEF)-like protein